MPPLYQSSARFIELLELAVTREAIRAVHTQAMAHRHAWGPESQDAYTKALRAALARVAPWDDR